MNGYVNIDKNKIFANAPVNTSKEIKCIYIYIKFDMLWYMHFCAISILLYVSFR